MKKGKNPFIPDILLDSVYEISPEFLTARGIRAVVLDIDNTLVTYGIPEPTEEVLTWIRSLLDSGIFIAIASNNSRERVERFSKTLSAFVIYRSRKPSPRAVLAACRHFGTTPAQTAVIGDQIFTDTLGANNAGVIPLLVEPIRLAGNPGRYIRYAIETPFRLLGKGRPFL